MPGLGSTISRPELSHRRSLKILKHFEGRLVEGNFNMHRLLVRAFGEWMKTDSSGATEWLDAMLASGKLECQGFGLRTNEQCRDQMAAEFSAFVIAKQLETDADLAILRFRALAPDQQAFILQFRLTYKWNPGSEADFVTFLRRVLPEDQYRARLQDRSSHFRQMGQVMAQEGGLEKAETQTMGDTGKWFEWMGEKLSPEDFQSAAHQRIGEWVREDTRAVEKWLATAADGPAKRLAESVYTSALAAQQPEP